MALPGPLTCHVTLRVSPALRKPSSLVTRGGLPSAAFTSCCPGASRMVTTSGFTILTRFAMSSAVGIRPSFVTVARTSTTPAVVDGAAVSDTTFT